ncbi:MAG: DNA topoisomerase IV subunit A [Planctomycetota bacterium JB042]
MTQLESLMRRNFLEYASYVVLDRAIPDVRDGLKPVQRRILHTLFEMDDGRFHKVANVIGETMKLHPHGDAAIRDALVVIANKEYFIEKQGNFGNLLTGHPAAAARYIECRLTPLARDTLFNVPLTTFAPSYDGRKQEPVFLPAKLPVLLMQGAEGIAVGMATRILPHNLPELLRAQIDLLNGKEVRVLPDFPQGGRMDAAEYEDGRGRVKVRARIEPRGEKTVVVTELPFGVTTESLLASIENASAKGQLKVGEIHDYTTDRVEIEIHLPRGTYADEVIPQLYAYTECEVSVSSSIVAIHGERPDEMTVSQALGFLTDQLLEQIRAELEYEISQLEDKRHALTLERIFIENRVYKRIEAASTDKAVRTEVWDGMHEYEDRFARPMVKDDVDRLLQIRIRRISLYDIEKHKQDLEEIERTLGELAKKLKNLKRTAIGWLESLLEKYGDRYPRRTEITTFEAVDKKEVARADIRLSYDPETGFYGSKVRGSRFEIEVSPYDKVLIVTGDGAYRIISPPEKTLIPGKVLFCGKHDPENGHEFTVVYRDADRIAWGKRVRIKTFIKDKEYSLIPGGPSDRTRLEILTRRSKPGTARIKFLPAKRQRVKEADFDLAKLTLKGVAARGNRLSPKPVSSVKLIKG